MLNIVNYCIYLLSYLLCKFKISALWFWDSCLLHTKTYFHLWCVCGGGGDPKLSLATCLADSRAANKPWSKSNESFIYMSYS